MIGNPKWFCLRKYTGWGLTPVTWQGWLYIVIFIIPIAIINSIPLDQNIKNIFTIVLAGLLIIDVLHIMTQIKEDEREKLHGAIADRNALWFVIFMLLIYFFIKQIFDPLLLIALIGATLIRAGTQFYLRDK
jgi:cobalamin synthase